MTEQSGLTFYAGFQQDSTGLQEITVTHAQLTHRYENFIFLG